jgi:hypothetical protein
MQTNEAAVRIDNSDLSNPKTRELVMTDLELKINEKFGIILQIREYYTCAVNDCHVTNMVTENRISQKSAP